MRRNHLWYLFVLIVLSLITCKASNPDSEAVQGKEATVPSTVSQSSNNADLVAELVNNFSFKLLKAINPVQNHAISPIGIFLALAITYLGSGGKTNEQLEEVLGMNSLAIHESRFHEDFSKLLSSLMPQNDEFNLNIVSAIAVSKNLEVRRNFVSEVNRLYSPLFKKVDFSDGASVMTALNDWVSKNTNNTIPRIMETPPDPMTRLILLSAVFFRGTWKIPFFLKETESKNFTLSDGTKKVAPMMTLYNQKFNYFHDQDLNCSFVKLPYEGDSISMIVALPVSGNKSSPLQMTHDLLCDIQSKMRLIEIRVLSIPKFRIDYSCQLKDPLKALGANNMFDRESADFSRMRPHKDLYVSSVEHKAVVEVDEKGSVAAAVTQVRFRPLSMNYAPSFVADRPFYYYIVDERSGLILFHGKVLDPSVETAERSQGRQTKPPRNNFTRNRQVRAKHGYRFIFEKFYF